ncbi:hypothetical protein [Vogesella oryzae]|uniref:hypothetical protein n=1 Tax=Vogesella oryzae TaxID=1735285 RepID=UPI00158213C9|nr:hypothetical protein [Vogesella oryzae]
MNSDISYPHLKVVSSFCLSPVVGGAIFFPALTIFTSRAGDVVQLKYLLVAMVMGGLGGELLFFVPAFFLAIVCANFKLRRNLKSISLVLILAPSFVFALGVLLDFFRVEKNSIFYLSNFVFQGGVQWFMKYFLVEITALLVALFVLPKDFDMVA